MKTPDENQLLAERSLFKLKAAVVQNDPAECIQAMDMLEEDDEFLWEDVDWTTYEEWDEIATEAADIILEHQNK